MELWNWKNFVGAVESAVVINTGLNSSTSIKVPASSWGLWPIKRIFNLQNGKTGIKSLGGRHNYQGRNIQIWSGKVKKENSKTAITIESQTHHFQPLISMFSISGLCWNADKLIWLISGRVCYIWRYHNPSCETVFWHTRFFQILGGYNCFSDY